MLMNNYYMIGEEKINVKIKFKCIDYYNIKK